MRDVLCFPFGETVCYYASPCVNSPCRGPDRTDWSVRSCNRSARTCVCPPLFSPFYLLYVPYVLCILHIHIPRARSIRSVDRRSDDGLWTATGRNVILGDILGTTTTTAFFGPVRDSGYLCAPEKHSGEGKNGLFLHSRVHIGFPQQNTCV